MKGQDFLKASHKGAKADVLDYIKLEVTLLAVRERIPQITADLLVYLIAIPLQLLHSLVQLSQEQVVQVSQRNSLFLVTLFRKGVLVFIAFFLVNEKNIVVIDMMQKRIGGRR